MGKGALATCPPSLWRWARFRLHSLSYRGRGRFAHPTNPSHTSTFSRRDSARVMQIRCLPLKREGAGNAGCALHPRSRVPKCVKKAHTSIQVQRRQSDIPCAMALRLISRSPRWSGLVVTVTPEKRASQELGASIAAPGPHDFAVRFGVFVRRDHSRLTPKRPSHPAPNVS